MHDRAHEKFDGADIVKRDLTLHVDFGSVTEIHTKRIITHLARGLVKTQIVPKLLLADSTGCVDLVTKNKERHLCELLDAEEGVEFGLALREALEVGTVDKEDDTVDLREVVAPQPTSFRSEYDIRRVRQYATVSKTKTTTEGQLTLQMSTEIVCRELHVADSKLFRRYRADVGPQATLRDNGRTHWDGEWVATWLVGRS